VLLLAVEGLAKEVELGTEAQPPPPELMEVAGVLIEEENPLLLVSQPLPVGAELKDCTGACCAFWKPRPPKPTGALLAGALLLGACCVRGAEVGAFVAGALLCCALPPNRLLLLPEFQRLGVLGSDMLA
jgi:hypothetical protein